MAGHLEGDGSVSIILPSECRRHLGFVLVRVDKTIKNPEMLHWFREKFGGKIYNFRELSTERSNNSDTLTWKLEHHAEVELCKQLVPHAHIKAREFDMAGRLPIDAVRRSALCPVRLVKGDEVRNFESHTAAGLALGRDPNAVRSALKRGGLCAGWRVEEDRLFTRSQLKQMIEQMYWSLRLMKQLPDDPVSKPLTLPYVAGLFDAEGSISISGNNGATVSISRKDPAIRIALQHQFGGRSHGIGWYVNGSWREFLELIAPYSIEKRKQIELVLSMDGNGQEIKTLIDPLQRNKRKASQAPA